MSAPKLAVPTQLGVLAVRLWVGLNFVLVHGLSKVQDPDHFLESVEMRRFPSHRELGWVVIVIHFVGGLLVTIGLQTRAAASALLGSMLVAAFAVHGDAPWEKREYALSYAVMMLFLALHGGGALSFDEWLQKRRRKMSPW